MKKITKEELEIFLRKHKLWLVGDEGGERADLRGADLRGANLWGANLWGANLRGADLRGADLRGADLKRANLREADLRGANLWGANLWGANLRGADLRGADLRGADLRGANLRGADLKGANLREADLRGADLRGANLNYPIACPEEGSFIGFKKVHDFIIKLEIPADAKRCSATSRKCRCEFAKVLSITKLDGSDADCDRIINHNPWYSECTYTVGEMVYPDSFDDDRWNECSHGIHFFITRQEAVDY